MLLRATVTARAEDTIALFVDSTRPFPLLLEDAAWRRAGVDVKSLASLPDSPTVKHGVVPIFRLAGLDLSKMPAVAGVDLAELTQGTDIDLGGVVGADLLAFFRVTFADEGRFVWLEPDPMLIAPPPPPEGGRTGAARAAPSTAPGSSASPPPPVAPTPPASSGAPAPTGTPSPPSAR